MLTDVINKHIAVFWKHLARPIDTAELLVALCGGCSTAMFLNEILIGEGLVDVVLQARVLLHILFLILLLAVLPRVSSKIYFGQSNSD